MTKIYLESLAEDFKLSASWEATQGFGIWCFDFEFVGFFFFWPQRMLQLDLDGLGAKGGNREEAGEYSSNFFLILFDWELFW